MITMLLRMLAGIMAMLLMASAGSVTAPKPEVDAKREIVAFATSAPTSMVAEEAEYDAFGLMDNGAAPGGAMTGAYAPMMPQSTEAYTAMQDMGYSSVSTSPLSTFAADVDTASYANVRRMIASQQMIIPDAVRVEEMINAFSYTDEAPQDGEPIAIHTQVADCPWRPEHLLLRINLKTSPIEMEKLPPSNLVFLIDSSGSMDEANKMPLVKRSFALLTEQLTANDRVSIVAYAGSEYVVLDGAKGNDTATILSAINDIEPWGGTYGEGGITKAYELAERYAQPGINSRIILATDGDFNIGMQSQADLLHLIKEKRESGIFLTVLGFGYGNLKDNTLQTLAEHGNGQAAYIDSIHEARRALVEELGATLVTVAKDVKLQVEFNPDTVEGYRLIGYETRRLANEDFADDTKDGGEMGAGHSVTALYELIPAGAGEMPAAQLTYQQQNTSGSEDFATVHVRYKQPDDDTSTEMIHAVPKDDYTDAPDDNFILSAAVAAFGQLISGSEYAGDADIPMILEMLQPMLSGDIGGRIVELYNLVRQSDGLFESE